LHGWRAHAHCLHLAQHTAGTLGHQRRPGVGRTHQGGGHGRLARVQAMGGFAKQRAAQGVQADDLAAKRHQVQVGLQNLVFAPAPLQHLRGHGLAQLLHYRAPARSLAQIAHLRAIEQARQLHGDGAGAARALVPQIAPGRCRHAAPVHAAVLVKALVFRQHHGLAQRR
jgi:hypothetical protein